MHSNLQNLLNFLMESNEVDEAAIGSKQMIKEKIAMHIFHWSDQINLVLYSTKLFTEAVLEDWFTVDQGEPIIGTITLKQNELDDAWEVKLSAAQKGYGPFLYQASSATIGWIMSDRKEVSPQARNVWKWMFEHPNQWKKHPIVRDTSSKKTKTNFLNFKYKWKGSKTITSKLLAIDKRTILQISNSTEYSKDRIESFLSDEAEHYAYSS